MGDKTITDPPLTSELTEPTQSPLREFVASIAHHKLVFLGKMVGRLLYTVDIRHRRIVRRNLKFAFPEWEWQRVLTVTRHVFENFGITLLEILQISCFSREDMQIKVRIDGEEKIKHLLSERGMIIISGHLGNWEMAFLFAASHLGDRVFAIARKIDFAPLDRWVYRYRTRFGGEVVNKKGALRNMTRAVRSGRVLATLIDQGTMPHEGIDATFFNRRVLATPGIAMLAMRARVPVMPAFCVRVKSGYKLILEEPIEMRRSKDLRADIQTNTQLVMDAIEAAVREYPEQYFWFHKRWKIYYPHLYSEDLEKLRRREEIQRRKSAAR